MSGHMNIELECDLAPDQWEVLKSLRSPAPAARSSNCQILKELVALGLVSTDSGSPTITPRGRHVLVRGSSRLLDVAA